MERYEWMAVLKKAVRELVAQELKALRFLEREAFIKEKGDARKAPVSAF